MLESSSFKEREKDDGSPLSHSASGKNNNLLPSSASNVWVGYGPLSHSGSAQKQSGNPQFQNLNAVEGSTSFDGTQQIGVLPLCSGTQQVGVPPSRSGTEQLSAPPSKSGTLQKASGPPSHSISKNLKSLPDDVSGDVSSSANTKCRRSLSMQVREAGEDVNAHRQTVNHTNERINTLLKDVLPEHQAPPVREIFRDGMLVVAEECREKEADEDEAYRTGYTVMAAGGSAAEGDAHAAARSKKRDMEELLLNLNFAQRDEQISQVATWLQQRAPSAKRDLTILEKIDRDCAQRESQSSFQAMSLQARVKKTEKRNIRELQQFCRALHTVGGTPLDQTSQESNQELLAMSDDELQQAIVDLQRQLEVTESEAWASLRAAEAEDPACQLEVIARSQSQSFRALKAEEPLDILKEQQKILSKFSDSLKVIEERRETVKECVNFLTGKVRNLGPMGEPLPMSDSGMSMLNGMRKEVAAKERPKMLAKRAAEYGDDLVMPSTAYLERLKAETKELESRAQKAIALKSRLGMAQLHQVTDFNEQLRLLEQAIELSEASRDWSSENYQDEDRSSPIVQEGERVLQKETEVQKRSNDLWAELDQMQTKLNDSTNRVQWLNAQTEEQESGCKVLKATLHVIQTQKAQILSAMSCMRGLAEEADKELVSIKSGPGGSTKRIERMVSHDDIRAERVDEDTDDEETLRKRSGSDDKAPASPTNSTKAAQSWCQLLGDEAVREVVTPPLVLARDAIKAVATSKGVTNEFAKGFGQGMEWVDVFHEGEDGGFSKELLDAQQQIIAALAQEEKKLQRNCEILEVELHRRMEIFEDLVKQDQLDQTVNADISEAVADARKSAEDFTKALKPLSAVLSVPAASAYPGEDPRCSSAHRNLLALNQPEFSSLDTHDFKQRREVVIKTRAAMRLLDNIQKGSIRAAGGGVDLRQAISLDIENKELMNKLGLLGEEVDEGREQFNKERTRRSIALQSKRWGAGQANGPDGDRRRHHRQVRQETRELSALRAVIGLFSANVDADSWNRQVSPAPPALGVFRRTPSAC
eukprot:TRINITY_DN35659_c0_g1_i1.p1 TRINITY_DN35659_c0_g1~~TRINITY_DN35659_c0_g1_i1.p1  ORF type:complete len:1045 (-),score=231.94 TRINITY_DN35659_c0_g1_i1:432-3566(-)